MHRINQVWPKWEAIEILGEGGFGRVYKAKRESFGQVEYSAIKVVQIPHNRQELDDMTASGMSKQDIIEYYYKSVQSLVDEIKMMGRLKSASHIVSIEDHEVVENKDDIGWTIYIRMELLTSIARRQLTQNQVKKMAIDILTALEFCHEQYIQGKCIIHRDIKPGNIFVSEFGEYKLGDFGISREVEKTNATMSQKGTKSYMAPEMIRMESYGKNVDLYALGLTMYELLNNGRMPFLPPFPQPFYPQNREEALLKRLSGEIFPDIEGIGELNTIIKKACHPNKSHRYQNATEMKKALLDIEKEKQNDFYIERTTSSAEEKTTMGSFNLFDDNKTNVNFDDNKTSVNEVELFKQEDVKVTQNNDKTMGVFSNNFLFEDTTVIQEEKVVEVKSKYIIKCPHCGGKAHRVFTNGYHCNSEGCYKVSLTVDDEIGRKRLMAYRKQHTDKTINSTLELYNLDSKSSNVCVYLSKKYEEHQQLDKAISYAVKAYELERDDANTCNYLGYLYGQSKNYEKAVYYYLEALHHMNEGRNSGFSQFSNVYLNLAVYSKGLQFDEQALYYLNQAFQYGYDSSKLREYQLGWKIGNEYMREIIQRNMNNNSYFKTKSINGRADQASITKARNQLSVSNDIDVFYALGPAKSGLFKSKTIERFTFCLTPYAFRICDVNNKLWYFSWYAISNQEISFSGDNLIIKNNANTYKAAIGKDVSELVRVLNQIKKEITSIKLGSEEAYTIKCPHCEHPAYKAFTHGYHCYQENCKRVFVTQNDKNTLAAKSAYLNFVNEKDASKKLSHILELVKLDPYSAKAYAYLAHEYDQKKNPTLRFNALNHAYSLDHEDTFIINRLAIWYDDQKDYQRAYDLETIAIQQHETKRSTLSALHYVYRNQAVFAQKLGRSKEAFDYIKEAYQKGHDFETCCNLVVEWGIGKEYVEKIVKGLLARNSSYLSWNTRSDHFEKARKDLKIPQNVSVYYANSYNNQCTFAITSRGIDYKCENSGLRYINFFSFNFDFKIEGECITFEVTNGERRIRIGNDAEIILGMLNDLKKIFI